MKCRDCAMFEEKKNLDGNYICNLCTGTLAKPDERDSDKCKYSGEEITNHYLENFG